MRANHLHPVMFWICAMSSSWSWIVAQTDPIVSKCYNYIYDFFFTLKWDIEVLLKADLHTPTSADFLNSLSKLKRNDASMQWLPWFKKIYNLFTDFGPILAWILLELLKDFVSADKVGVYKSALSTNLKWNFTLKEYSV